MALAGRAFLLPVCCVCLCRHMAVTARVCRVARVSVVARVRIEETAPHIYVVWFTHVVVDWAGYVVLRYWCWVSQCNRSRVFDWRRENVCCCVRVDNMIQLLS